MFEANCLGDRVFRFDPAHTALIIVDMQRDFVDTDGACGAGGMDVAPLQAIIPRTLAVLHSFRELGATVVHTRYGFKPDLSDLPQAVREQSRDAGGEYGTAGPLGRILTQGEPGYEIIPELTPKKDEIVIDKNTFDAFCNSPLDSALRDRGVTHAVVCGVTTQCCVEGTIRGAIDRGYYVMMLDDCCGAFEARLHEGTKNTIQSEGHLFGWIGTSGEVLAAISQRAA